ncbi:ABC transporter substrate-binding protein [Cohnella rhizoplanae]|uniref:ABC transporter substrate-binding protein n=1 Tax=Cohnella rhizoplanae TaxID=2974897 RepID=UPI00232CDB75|nr:ABC transporter substrate-binding protein [Cohnella sp. JJ-181]
MLLALFVSACSSKADSPSASGESDAPSSGSSGSAAAPSAELPPVKLTYYFPQGELQKDYASVEEAVNQYIQPKLNATVKFMPVVFGDYEQKLNTIVSSGENFDIGWTSNWMFNYESNAEKGAFQDLGELLPKYGADFMKSLPESVIEGSKTSKGKLMAIPNYQVAAKAFGFVIQKEYLEKYNFDVNSIKSFEDLEPFLEVIKKNEPDAIPYFSLGNSFSAIAHGYAGIDNTYYKKGDPDYKLIQLESVPEYMTHTQMLYDWFNKGYIPKDVATANFDETLKTGKIVSYVDWTLQPGGEANIFSHNGGHEVVFVPLTQPEFSGVQPTMTFISRTSKNPERAMMFLNLMNTDSKLFNLMAYGIEGKHYDKVGANTIKLKPEGGYAPDVGWAMGNVIIGYLKEGQPEDTWQKTIELNNTAFVPDIFGFSFDPSGVKTEIANLDAVFKEYDDAVKSGSVDPAVYLPKMVNALKKAGSEKVLQERQKQLDEWLKSKGKK